MYDYIIVGQGLAGSAVALQLLRHGRNILVIDNPATNYTSRIAAGLFNPVTGRKMVRTWMADTLFPYLHSFYQKAEDEAGTRFFHPYPIYRPFVSVEEQNEWMARSIEPEYIPFVDRVVSHSIHEQLRDPFGGLMVRQGGFLDTTAYVDAVRARIQYAGNYLEGQFDYNLLTFDMHGVYYGKFSAQKIIFCTGVHANPWFRWLPVKPLKGETLSIASSFREQLVVNRGIYLVPISDTGRWRVGATYPFHDDTKAVTEAGRTELEAKLRDLTSFPFDVVQQDWGFRPTTPDRRPLIGRHPLHENLIVFNGLGTKGVSLAPYFSDVLIHWLENTGPIHKDVDIERYKSLYSGSPS